MSDIRVVVGLDFGTTYSGFTYCHVDEDGEYKTNEDWPGETGQCQYKTNTVLQYEENLVDVKSWGYPALSGRPNRLEENKRNNVAELFKLHLGNLDNLQPQLREKYRLSVNYKKAITDYLREIGKCMKETVGNNWEVDFLERVLLVLTVPAEYSEKAKAIMRECAYNAGLINDKASVKLQFTTEPEAAAIYCMKTLGEHDLAASGTTFMIVDCGGGTVDLTTRKLLDENRLGEVTERAGDYCGSSFIDDEYINHLKKELGENAINSFRDNHYGQLQYMVQEFCQQVKLPFTGDDPSFSHDMDLLDVSAVLSLYLDDSVRRKMEDAEWLIHLDNKTIKSMFDLVIDRILRMIEVQLKNSRKNSRDCSAMFLVGGFSQSEYLQMRIRDEFRSEVANISVPTNPVAAISRGAAIYGLSFRNWDEDMTNTDGLMFVIDSRVLGHTYGIRIFDRNSKSNHFHCIGNEKKAKRGTIAKINEEFTVRVEPTNPFQKEGVFDILYTRDYEAGGDCEGEGKHLLGKLKIDWPDVENGLDRPTVFKLAFGKMEITATATNETNGQNYQTTFEIDAEDS